MNKILSDVLIKKPYTRMSYTENQLLEFSKCSNAQYGPFYFMENFFWIQSRGKCLLTLRDYQVELIENYHDHQFSVNLLGRQLGKCLEEKVNITIKNKKTGKIYDIPIGKFTEYRAAQENNQPIPDISEYERKEK